MTEGDRGGAEPAEGRCPLFQDGSGLAPRAVVFFPLGRALGRGLCWGSSPGGFRAVGPQGATSQRQWVGWPGVHLELGFQALWTPPALCVPAPSNPLSLGSELITLQAANPVYRVRC